MIVKRIFLIIVLLYTHIANAQTIKGDYTIIVRPINEIYNDTSFYKLMYGIEVEAKYFIEDFFADTISFNVKNWAQAIGPSNLFVTVKDTSSRTINKEFWYSNFDGNSLKIYLKNQNSPLIITVKYSYIGSTYVSILESNKRNIIVFGGNDTFEILSDMFFTPNNYKLLNRTLNIINHTKLVAFSSLHSSCRDSESDCLEFTFLKNSILNNTVVFLVDTSVYVKINKVICNRPYIFYIRKENLSAYDSILSNTTGIIDSKIKPSKHKNSFSIIEFDWQNKRYAMGKTYSNSMLIDKSFLSKNKESFTHEFLHTALNNDYEEYQTNGFYVINESLIEYLAIYISNLNDSLTFNESFVKKGQEYLLNDSLSLFNLKSNTSESFDIVYNYGPIIIYNLAKEIGFDKFFHLAIDFFSIYNKEPSYINFIKFLEKNNIQRRFIEKFENDVRY